MLFRNITLIDSDYQVRTGHNVLVEGKRITYIGKELPPESGEPVYEGSGCLLLPGFFNMHCHVPKMCIRDRPGSS